MYLPTINGYNIFVTYIATLMPLMDTCISTILALSLLYEIVCKNT